jgi:FkbM family methyltransferase
LKLYEVVQAAGRLAGLRITRFSPAAEAGVQFAWHAKRLGARTVLDIGAADGRTGVALRREGWDGAIVSFEPLPGPRRKLEARATGDPLWHVAPPVALGAAEGEVAFNVAENLESSSILPTAQRSIDAAANTRVVEQITVRVAPLDALLAADWTAPYAMKLDTQGFEFEVLKGAERALAQTRVVMLEMSLVPLYEGGADFAQLFGFLAERGFTCVGLHKGFTDLQRMEMLQVDGVFVRG